MKAGLVAAALAAVLVGDLATVAFHDEGHPHRIASPGGPPTSSPTASPTTPPTVAPKPRPKPPPRPAARILFSLTKPVTPTQQHPATKPYTVLPGGQGLTSRPSAGPYRLSQVKLPGGLVVTTKVLNQTTTQTYPGGYCNAFYGCPTDTYTSTEQGIVLRDPVKRTSKILTRGGFDDTPSWSPDGQFIAYDSLRQSGHVIGVTDTSGDPLEAFPKPPAGSQDTDPVWAPNSQAVAALRTNSAGVTSIVVLYLDGRPRRVLATGTGLSDLAWSPDGKTIAYLKPRIGQHLTFPQFRFGTDLFAVSVATGRSRALTSFALPSAYRQAVTCGGFRGDVTGALGTPMWSPDSRFLAFASSYPHRNRGANEFDVEVLDTRSNHVTTSFHTPDTTCGPTATQPTTTQLLGWIA